MKTISLSPSKDLHIGADSLPGDAAFLSAIIETQSDIAAVEMDLRIIMRMVAERTQKLTGAMAALRESEERFRSSFTNASIGMALVALDGRWLQVNRSLCDIVGYSEPELLASDFQSITHPDDLDTDLDHVRKLVAGETRSYQMVKRYFHKQGHVVWILLSVSLVRNDAGKPIYFISQIQDITDRKRAESLERDRGEVLELVAQDRPLSDVVDRLTNLIERQTESGAAVMLLDGGEITIHAQNLPDEFVAAIRRSPVRLAAALISTAVQTPPEVQVTDMTESPAWRGMESVAADHGLKRCWATPIHSNDGSTLGLLTVYCRQSRHPTESERQMLEMASKLATISIEHHQTTRQLAHLVRHDPLTGMPNRILFEDRLQQALASAGRNGKMAALFVLDVDRFKSINDTHGHQAGDALLQQFAHRVRSLLRTSDTLARVGGDEFLLLLPELASSGGAEKVAATIVEALVEPFVIGGQELVMTSSIGIAIYPQDGMDSAALQASADAAMYTAKRNGKNQFALHDRP